MKEIRQLLARALDWRDAHVGFDAAVADLAPALRGVRPDGLPHSTWELLEHLRLTQRDILDFCRAEPYEEMRWPDAYWPATPAPPSDAAWDASVAAFRADREALKRIARDESIDLTALVPHATKPTQTYAREIVVVVDHTSYHVGQIVLVRRALEAWRS